MAQSRVTKPPVKPVQLKPSDVIRMAASHALYCQSEHWLCCLIYHMEGVEKSITPLEAEAAVVEIQRALGRYTFLRHKLEVECKITHSDRYATDGYSKAAQNFWKELVTKLQSIGK